ncbi:MAG: hypothetical protein CMB73_04495 [Euryarchaeota archaeon]|nr:hypothetical protein [Euryarchaeota archaeon]
MSMDANDLYLDALEALEALENEKAIELANKALALDPEHLDAMGVLSDALMPGPRESTNLANTSKNLAIVRKIVKLSPERTEMWARGAHLMRILGMWEQAIDWWQECRKYGPDEATPIVEQASLLSEMGLYKEAGERLDSIFDENLSVGASQNARIMQLVRMTRKALAQNPNEHFKPWQKGHDGWDVIRVRMNKGPISQNTVFLLTVAPLLLFIILLSGDITGSGIGGLCIVSLVIAATVVTGTRLSNRWYQQLNKPSFNLLRAMDVEASTGKKVIPEDIRISKLYIILLGKTPRAYQERAVKIVEINRKLPANWKPNLPDFDSHKSEDGTFWDVEENPELEGYEEE